MQVELEIASDVTILWYTVTVMLGILGIRELLQFGIAPRRYFFSFENWLEVILIGLVAALLFYGPFECHIDAKRQVKMLSLAPGGGLNFSAKSAGNP